MGAAPFTENHWTIFLDIYITFSTFLNRYQISSESGSPTTIEKSIRLLLDIAAKDENLQTAKEFRRQ